jgi:hypothetical protein
MSKDPKRNGPKKARRDAEPTRRRPIPEDELDDDDIDQPDDDFDEPDDEDDNEPDDDDDPDVDDDEAETHEPAARSGLKDSRKRPVKDRTRKRTSVAKRVVDDDDELDDDDEELDDDDEELDDDDDVEPEAPMRPRKALKNPRERPGPRRSRRTNLLEEWADETMDGAHERPLEVVRLESSETIVVPFTADHETVHLHYCKESEIGGYVLCNGDDCVLCEIGRERVERRLLPVYLPVTACVAVLPISPSCRPGALRPQILPILGSAKRVALLIRKLSDNKYVVTTRNLTAGLDDGAKLIKDFSRRWDAEEVSLASTYAKWSNSDLEAIDPIAKALSFKRASRR